MTKTVYGPHHIDITMTKTVSGQYLGLDGESVLDGGLGLQQAAAGRLRQAGTRLGGGVWREGM